MGQAYVRPFPQKPRLEETDVPDRPLQGPVTAVTHRLGRSPLALLPSEVGARDAPPPHRDGAVDMQWLPPPYIWVEIMKHQVRKRACRQGHFRA